MLRSRPATWLAQADPVLATGLSLVVVALLYGAVVGHQLADAAFNPLVLARMSREFPAERFWDQSPPFEVGVGHDGQFFYYLARDPLLLGGPPVYLDEPGYRYQRLLLPLLAYALGLGQPAAIGWSLLAVNLLGLGLGCWFAARLLDDLGASRWWLLAYALNPGYLLGLPMDLSEPVALGLVTAALWLWLRQRHLLAAAALAIAMLAREAVVVVALVLAAHELIERGSPRRSLAYLAPLGAAVVWQLVVLWRVGELPFANGPVHLGVPFEGIIHHLRVSVGAEPAVTPEAWTPTRRLAELLATGTLAASAALAVATLRPALPPRLALAMRRTVARRPARALVSASALRWQLAVQGLFLLALNWRVWDESFSYARAAYLLYLFYLLVVLERRRRAPAREREPQAIRPSARQPSAATHPPRT